MVVEVAFDVTSPETHLVRVTMRFPATADARRTFRMAAWVPGSYKIRDYARHVQDITATVGDKRAPIRRVGKDGWEVARTADADVAIAYDVYCRAITVQGSHVTSDHGHLFPATLLLWDASSRGEPHRLEVQLPDGWKLFSGLENGRLDGTLVEADNYDHLVDCPVETGPADAHHVIRFRAGGKMHRLVVWQPPPQVDWDRIKADMSAVVEATHEVWGEVPYDHYTFVAHVALDHGGGLEHRNSTTLGIDPLQLLVDEKIRTRFLPLVAHEFFHTWNIKRIQPAAFQPYDLQTEVHTGLMWLFEGFTTYYELPILHRAGVVDADTWGKIAAEMLKYYEMARGRTRISVADASRLGWTLLYQIHEQNINRNVSYYVKGMFVGLCLDWHIRTNAKGAAAKAGLDGVMRLLWHRHGVSGTGLTEDGFPAIVAEATGLELRSIRRLMTKWTERTDGLPIDKALRDLGWLVEWNWQDDKRRIGLGVQFKKDGCTIERITDDSPSWRVLQPDDELVAADGYKWDGARFADWVCNREAGDTVAITAFREGRLRTFDVPLREMPKDNISVKPRTGDVAATRRRIAWLGAAKS